MAIGLAGCSGPTPTGVSRVAWRHVGSLWVASTAAYRMTVAANGTATLESAGGQSYTTFPLAAAPTGAQVTGSPRISASHGALSVAWGSAGAPQASASVQADSSMVVIGFAIAPHWPSGTAASGVDFFSNGATGLNLGGRRSGFTPQSGPQISPSQEYMDYPFVSTSAPAPNGTRYYAFAPPPLDITLQFAAGWLGVGVVQVPDATIMQLAHSGAVVMDYPWQAMSKFADSGAGGMAGGMVSFPQFVLTFAPGAYRDMAAYGQALTALGMVHKAPLQDQKLPSWWYGPLVCTYGQEEVDGITNFAPGRNGYTAAWVKQFAQQWAQRFGDKQFTLIIDATWQANPGTQRRVGTAQPGPLFGGYSGMRALINALHAQGIHVLLWWQAWASVPGTQAAQMGVWHNGAIDPTSPQFPAYVREVTQRLLGSGPGDLNADGLKIDFNYLAPDAATYPWDNPALGMGTAASYRYFSTFYKDAHAVKPDALITISIATPQFAGVMDAVRLNDASNEAQWQARARVVAAAMPEVLIDSDGGNIQASTALTHFLTAAVYGIPDDYFLTRWINGAMSAAQATLIGQIMQLAGSRSIGQPVYVGPDNWAMVRNGRVVAQDLSLSFPLISSTVALDVWSAPDRVVVLSTQSGSLDVPLYGTHVTAATAGGKAVRFQTSQSGVLLDVQAGQEVTLTLSGREQVAPKALQPSA